MIVLFVLLVSALVARLLGMAGVEVLDSWPAATRVGLAVMLFFTATAHFNAMKFDLARMMPTWVPKPLAMVTFTGICEVLGAIGLLVPATRRLAAIALVAFLVAIFPANVHAAREGLLLGGKPVTPLWLRIPMQLTFIVLTLWSGVICAR